MSTTIIAYNSTQKRMLLNDLGVFIDATSSVELTEIFELDDICSSDNLKNKVTLEEIIINDGESNLSVQDALNHISVKTKWEDSGFEVNFTMSDNASHDYIEVITTSYTTVHSFIFKGKISWKPKYFSIIGSRSVQAAVGTARIFDYTNGEVISEVEWSDENKAIYTSSTSNLPDDEAIFELQVKSSAQGKIVRVHYISLF